MPPTFQTCEKEMELPKLVSLSSERPLRDISRDILLDASAAAQQDGTTRREEKCFRRSHDRSHRVYLQLLASSQLSSHGSLFLLLLVSLYVLDR